MSVPIGEIITAAGIALSLYNKLKAAAGSQGMTPDEFDASAERECSRIDGWKAKTDAAEEAARP